VKAKFRGYGEKTLNLEWVLVTAKMDMKRWNTVKKWECERYGEQRITDLSWSEVWHVVGLPNAGKVVPRTSRAANAYLEGARLLR
jgi:hypothetical protein